MMTGLVLRQDDKIFQISLTSYRITRKLVEYDRNVIVGVLKRFILLTEIDNVPSPEIFDLVVNLILEEFPAMQIGDFVLALKGGISGKYGPIYNSIRIDTMVGWMRKFYDEDWKTIDLMAEYNNKKNHIYDESNCIPAPDYIKKQSDELLTRLTTAKNLKSRNESRLKYLHIEDFCIANKVDVSQWNKWLYDQIIEQYHEEKETMQIDIYISVMRQRHLARLNGNLGRILEQWKLIFETFIIK